MWSMQWKLWISGSFGAPYSTLTTRRSLAWLSHQRMEATMLRRLFPRDHLRYAESPFGDWLHHFADWLVATGYTSKPAHNHVRRLKQALERAGSEVVGSDGKFRAGTI